MTGWMQKVVLGAFLVLGGCTELTAKYVDDGTEIVHGVAYQLPEMGYLIEIKRVLTKCPVSPDYEIGFDVSAEAAASLRPGPTVLIDYRDLAGSFKTSDADFELYDNGMLRSFNVSVDDRTAEVIAEGVKAAVSIASMAMGVPPVSISKIKKAGERPPELTLSAIQCTPEAIESLAKIPGIKQQVKASADDVTKLKEDLEQAQTAQDDKPADQDGKKNATDPLKGKKDALKAAEKASAKAAKAYTDELDSITLIDRLGLVPDGSGEQETYSLKTANDGAKTIADLFQVAGKVEDSRAGQPVDVTIPFDKEASIDIENGTFAIPLGVNGVAMQDIAADVGTALSHWVSSDEFPEAIRGLAALSPVTVASGPVAASARKIPSLSNGSSCGESSGSQCGIVYRTLAVGRLQICDGTKLSEACGAARPKAAGVLFNEERVIPQLGHLVSLPFSNRAFMDNHLSAEFHENGTLLKAGYKKTSAEAEGALAALNNGLEGIQGLIDAKGAAKEEPPSQVQKVQNEKALFDAERERAEAEIQLIQKRRELEALRSSGP